MVPWSRCMLAVILGGSSVMKKTDWHLKFDILQFLDWCCHTHMWRLIFATSATSATSGNLFFFATCVIANFLMQRIVFQRFGFACGTWCLCFFRWWFAFVCRVFILCVRFFPSEKIVLTRQCGILCVAGVSFWLGSVVSCAWWELLLLWQCGVLCVAGVRIWCGIVVPYVWPMFVSNALRRRKITFLCACLGWKGWTVPPCIGVYLKHIETWTCNQHSWMILLITCIDLLTGRGQATHSNIIFDILWHGRAMNTFNWAAAKTPKWRFKGLLK